MVDSKSIAYKVHAGSSPAKSMAYLKEFIPYKPRKGFTRWINAVHLGGKVWLT